MESSIVDKFISETKTVFSFLLGWGFILPNHLMGVTPTFVKVVFLGKNVAVVLCLDYRDRVIDLYVGKVIDGEIVDSAQGGYFDRFSSYLLECRGFRGSLSNRRVSPDHYKKLTFEEKIDSDLKEYADALQKYGGDILNDSDAAFHSRGTKRL